MIEYRDKPEKALELAEKAMEVWIPWEDNKVIEYPDIDPPDINQQFGEIAKNIAEGMTRQMKQSKSEGMSEGDE